jgi:transglutaminase-like putative cysteine protease
VGSRNFKFLGIIFILFSLYGFTQQQQQDLSQFLQETPHMDYSNLVFAEVLSKVVTEDMSLALKLEKLFYFTRDSIPFASDASLTASGALKKMQALCYTKAMIYVSFCRRLGVPAQLAYERFIIKAAAKKYMSGHGIAKIYYNGKWIYIDTVSNKDAWSWWDKEHADAFELPVFSLEHNVLVDEKFISDLALEDSETNDVPKEWLEHMEKFLKTGKW